MSLASTADYEISPAQTLKKSKPKPFGLLSRTKSGRDKDGRDIKDAKDGNSPKSQPIPPPIHIIEPDRSDNFVSAGLQTAPVPPDRAFRDMMASTVRNRSEDRATPRDIAPNRENNRDKDQVKMAVGSYKENGGGSAFLSGLKNSSTRAADMISKGLFRKRGGGTMDKEPIVDDENYVLKVINLPLVEQARLTRISKRLEDSRDKTEVWMHAFPWRAIDYLNYKG